MIGRTFGRKHGYPQRPAGEGRKARRVDAARRRQAGPEQRFLRAERRREAVLGGEARRSRIVPRAWCTLAGAAGGVGATAVELRQLVDSHDVAAQRALDTMDVLAWCQMQLLEHVDPVAARHDGSDAREGAALAGRQPSARPGWGEW
mgnify:CR=1 FL=1